MAKQMTNADNFWLCMDEPANLMVITAFMEFEEPLDFKRLLATIDTRIASFPRFHKRVVRPKSGVGLPSWETDPNYDLRSHIHRVALPGAGDKADLQEMISNLTVTPLDPNRPLWQVHLIENYGDGCVLFYRIHHCIADGISLMYVLLSTADTDPDAPWPTGKDKKKKPAFSMRSALPLSSLVDSARETVTKTKKMGAALVKEVSKAAKDPDHLKSLARTGGRVPTDFAKVLSSLAIMKSDPNTPFKGRLGTRKKVAWSDPVPLERIKEIGRAIKSATINDVLISAVTGAMRSYLKTRKVPVNELDLRVAVPFNVRKPGTEFELGNKFSLVFLPLPVYLEDAVLRLKEVKRRMDRLKTSPEPYINFGMLSGIGYLPPDVAKKAAHLFGNKSSGVLSNVPGPRQTLYFAGTRLHNFMFWVPRSGNIGLGISIVSYDGKVTVGIASDEGLMPDPQVLLECFNNELDYMLKLVQSGKVEEDPLVLHDRYSEGQTSAKAGKKRAPAASRRAPGACQALTKKGKPCSKKARPGSRFCTVHKGQEKEDARLQDVARLMKELTK
ncbi:MAG: wax ester/triacylglycerol synthase family O-acyltransferase [Desulfobacterales bacterium]|nr:wax ester/triacylglycerol synthase family O-acyltransferase [Desulfobacterales bacterium]